MPLPSDDSRQSVSDSFKGSTGSASNPFPKMWRMMKGGPAIDPTKEALNRRQAKMNEMKADYGTDSGTGY